MKPKAKLLSAFTLLEIMIVITIIGVLAAVAVPNLRNAMTESRRKACAANLRQLEGAKMRWALDHRKDAAETPTDAELFGLNAYIREKPLCPSSGSYSLNPVDAKPTCSVADHTY